MKKFFVLALICLMSSTIFTALSQEQVSQAVYVFDGSFNGTMLSDVEVTGEDAAGNVFQGITDSSGMVMISGQPGTWQFVFMKDGYDTLSLKYDVTENGEGGVYLTEAT